MVQTSVQFTPVQVLQAARRAEAEGKMDYALQFYRHLVEQHGTTAEAQEAREGLFRIAEWRWGEARVARNREAGIAAGGGQASQSPPSPPGGSQQRVYNVANNAAPNSYAAEPQAAVPSGMPQIISRQHEPRVAAVVQRFRAGRVFAHALSGAGWLTLLAGVVAAVAGIAGLVGELSAIALMGAPVGVMLGIPAVLLGLVLVVSGQLAAALFESASATLDMASLERARART